VVTPGYAILATSSDEALERWVEAHEFVSFTPEGPREVARFRELVQGARELGYWTTEQLLDPGLRGIAVALRDRKGDCMGAVGMTVPMMPHTREQMVARLLPILQETAQALRPLL
jgi:IclR family pca regulon transcriptional regulator